MIHYEKIVCLRKRIVVNQLGYDLTQDAGDPGYFRTDNLRSDVQKWINRRKFRYVSPLILPIFVVVELLYPPSPYCEGNFLDVPGVQKIFYPKNFLGQVEVRGGKLIQQPR